MEGTVDEDKRISDRGKQRRSETEGGHAQLKVPVPGAPRPVLAIGTKAAVEAMLMTRAGSVESKVRICVKKQSVKNVEDQKKTQKRTDVVLVLFQDRKEAVRGVAIHEEVRKCKST